MKDVQLNDTYNLRLLHIYKFGFQFGKILYVQWGERLNTTKYNLETKIWIYPEEGELTWEGQGCEALSCSRAVALWSGSAKGSFGEVNCAYIGLNIINN